ncbi:MAG: tRNA glutamyl-Q(34) synthetase GluQRS [Ruminococcaceae bacterium]|nr:tRNA glutamyl-Q(34) synthetase GluQRS [Oscillospiraceae bacterium]
MENLETKKRAVSVGRFAPSPSGRMHLGNVFSALLAWLSVRSVGGKMVLRIEDLDPDRSKSAFADAIRQDLQWLGLDWDWESPCQSERTPVYRSAFEQLAEKGLVYPCYCTRAQLHAASAPHASDGKTVYSGACRNLSEAERAAMTRKPAWRLKCGEGEISFRDGLRGIYRENLQEECGDFIIRRSDGVYAYQLAVVVDDGDMGITQVVRGSDLLSSTPRQLYLYRLLGLNAPRFYHVPLLVAPDGRRLSKRDGDLDLQALREHYSAEELIGLLACAAGLLDEPVPCTPQELARKFDWSRVTREETVNIREIIGKMAHKPVVTV